MHWPDGANPGTRLQRAARLLLAAAVWTLAAWFGLGLALLGAFELSDYQHDRLTLESLTADPARNGTVNRALITAQRYWLSGTPGDRAVAEQRIADAMRQAPDSLELRLLQARWAAYHHRPAEAAALLTELGESADAPSRLGLVVDIAIQQGRIEDANALLTETARQSDWALSAQYAALLDKTGQAELAEPAYQSAEEMLTSKAMRDFAWLELQRGYRALSHGDSGAAETHYRLAMRAYSGYWLAADYWGEWLATQRRFDEAVAVFRQLAICTRKPEFYQSLGDLYLYLGKTADAKHWHDLALHTYLDAARRGETHYDHHLAALYADAYLDGANATEWARRDLARRPNSVTHDALAWALYRDGQFDEALQHARAALSYGWEDPHIYNHAGMILLAAGLNAEAQAALQHARQINPDYDAFHVHR